jgi:hypothetical protein
MTTHDVSEVHYAAAVISWFAGDKGYKLFAEEAAQVADRQTKALADDCHVSPDTIESYRNAARLRHELEAQVETPEVSRVWQDANISLWIAAAKRRKAFELDKLFDCLKDATDNGSTVEQFRVYLDGISKPGAEWERRLSRLVRGFGKLVTDWKTELPPPARERLERLAEHVESELREIAGMEVENV